MAAVLMLFVVRSLIREVSVQCREGITADAVRQVTKVGVMEYDFLVRTLMRCAEKPCEI